MYVYYPSCNFTKASRENALKIRNYLKKKMKVAGCCLFDYSKLEEDEVALVVCQSCDAVIDEKAKGEPLSLFAYLLEDEDFIWPDYQGVKMTLQDCFRAKDNEITLNAVRACMEKMNIEIVEIENNREKADYCGDFFYKKHEKMIEMCPNRFGEEIQSRLVDYTEEEKIMEMKAHATQYTTDLVVVYCNACLRGLKMAGVNGVHLLDLMVRDLS